MSDRIQALIGFYRNPRFTTWQERLAAERLARENYESLTPDEQSALVEHLLNGEIDEMDATAAFCCLACFHPGSLTQHHQSLLRHGFAYPGVIFHGASPEVAEDFLRLLDDSEQWNVALCALAWIGGESVVDTFRQWRDTPPAWAAQLPVPPDQYTLDAGWELTESGQRRDLFSRTAYPLVRPDGGTPEDDGLRIGMRSDEICPWCGRNLVTLLAVEDHRFLPDQAPGPIVVLTCNACTLPGPIFSGGVSRGVRRVSNVDLDEWQVDPDNWDDFPEQPLTWSGETSHYLRSAHAIWLPGISASQVGGMPNWVQDPEYPCCPDCSRTMPFIGQIDNHDYDDSGDGTYYCFRCPECRVTATTFQQS